MKRHIRHLVPTFLLVILVPLTVMGQATPASQGTPELRQQLEELRAQMAAQLKQMNALQARIDEIERAKAAAPAASLDADKELGLPASTPSGHVSEATAGYETVAQDPHAAPRVNNTPLDPKYPGFFRLPGTQTLLKIGGYFKSDFIYDGKPAGNPEQFIPSSIPFAQPGVNNSTVSIRPTRLSLDFHIPVKALGDVRFYVEGDLFGSNATTPRLRHAYTQVKNFLLGQTFSNFMDPDAGPDGLDFQGPNSQFMIRNPQLRYTVALAKKTSLSFSVEKPSSDVAFKTPEFSALPNSPSPDGTVKLREETSGGHIQISGLFRDVAAYLPNGSSDSVFGWGVAVAGSQRVVGKDTLVYQGAYGAGMQRYVNDTSGLGIDAAIISNQEPRLRATPMVATYFGYQHYWASRVRSSVIYGFAQVNNTAYQPGSTYHKSNYVGTNLIWNAVGSLNIGTEFLYGWVVMKDNSSANAPRIIFSAKYDLNFVRKPE